MEKKTKVMAEAGRHDLTITRDFELPVDLLFRAYVDAEIVEQWMGTRVVKLENKRHGSFQFETTDPMGNKHRFNGTIHDFAPDKKITRTFEFEGAPFGVQLEFLEFEGLSDKTSRLSMHVIFRTPAQRDQQLQMPFAQGLNMAHNRLQEIANKLK